MTNKLYNLVDWMIPKKLKVNFFKNRKARILSFIYLFTLFTVIALEVVSTSFGIKNDVPLWVASGLICILIFVFKKWGNLLLSGNLLAAVIFGTIAPSISESGGLYSDNLLWLLTVPLIALLITNRFSGFIWTGILLATTCYFFHLENQAAISYRLQIQDLPADYFFISYLAIFIVIVGIVFIFAKGQADIIKNLQEQQELLLRQKVEITRQADSLRATQILLKKSNEELNDFASAAAHDLKEPLRMIKLYTQLTVKRIDEHLDENTREFISYVTDGVTRMNNLLEDLLNYAQLGSKKEDTKHTDLNDILFLVINNLSATMQDTQTAIFVNDLPELKSSSTEMTQLFQNLLSNSIKFRQQNVNPEIHIKHQLDGSQHLISISDNGIGIAQEHQEKVFSIFQRLHSREAYEGAGIGLATCKKIVEKMDGKIWANSEIGRGTTFYIKFPSAN